MGLRFRLSKNPLLYNAFLKIFKPNKKLLYTTTDTEIVIEGFPRSANTFAVVAFQYAQRSAIKIAHHLHAQSQIIKGVTLGLPVCVLIRNPFDTIASFIVAFPEIEVKVALECYIQFYKDLYYLKDYFVVADFEETTKDFSLVIEKINRKFDKKFSILKYSEEDIDKIKKHIKNIKNQNKYLIPLPDAKKESLKRNIQFQERDKKLLEQAQSIYIKFQE